LLLAGIFSAAGSSIDTPELEQLSHILMWGINLACMTNIIQYIYRKCKVGRAKKKAHCRKFGPLYCVIAATFFVMADLTRHVLNDVYNILPEYYHYPDGIHPRHTLNTVGVLFVLVFTWTGFALLFVGIFWAIALPKKVHKQYKKIMKKRREKKAKMIAEKEEAAKQAQFDEEAIFREPAPSRENEMLSDIEV
jgi:hypothetical protein